MTEDAKQDYYELKTRTMFECPNCHNVGGRLTHMDFEADTTRFWHNCVLCGENWSAIRSYSDLRTIFYMNDQDRYIRAFMLGMYYPTEMFKTDAVHLEYRKILTELYKDITGSRGRRWEKFYTKVEKIIEKGGK